MKQLRQLFLYLSALVLMGCAGSAHSEYPSLKKMFLPAQYSAEAIEGKVVDADTRAPLEGVIVIAIWELERSYNRENPILSGHMQVTEVLTDAEGHYVIPAWGPKERPEGTYMNRNDPLIVVFKEEYDYMTLKNPHEYSPDTRDKREEAMHNSVWNGKTVELKKFEGNLEEYYARLRRVSSTLDSLFAPVFGAGACDWQKIPNMVFAFDEFHHRLVRELPRNLYTIRSLDELVARGNCGTKEEFIKEYKK